MPQAATIISFVTRLNTKALSTTEAGAPASSWNQVAVVGQYVSSLYGEFSITEADLQQMLDNFQSGRYPVPPTEICMDYDHLSMQPPAAGDGKAAGWFKQVELRAQGQELWARVDWTEAGASAIKSLEYRFVSPTFHKAFVTNTGENIGCTLLGAAITNQPFLQGMDPLSIAASRRLGGARPAVIALTEFSFYERCNRLQESLADRLGCDAWCCYVQDVYDDFVVYRYDSRLYRLDYTIADDGKVTFGAMPQEVTVQYAALGLSRPAQETKPMAIITLKNAQGQDVQVDETAIEQLPLVKELRAKVPPADATVVKATEFATLQSQVTTLSTRVQTAETAASEAKAQLLTNEMNTSINALLDAGKITPAQRESYEDLFKNRRDTFDKLTATLSVVSPVKPREVGSAGSGAASAEDAIDAAVKTLRSTTPGLTYEQAYDKVLQDNPQMYTEYEASRAATH